MLKRIAVLVSVGLALPLCAHALGERTWLTVNSGGGSYSMSDLNQEIEAYNAANPNNKFGNVDHGMSLGAALGYDTSGPWSIGFGLDRLYADTKATTTTDALEYNLAANCWRVFGDYGFHPRGKSMLRAGIGAGIIAENGQFIVSASGTAPDKVKITGTGPLLEAYGGGAYWVSTRFALEGAAGYRYAHIKEVKISGGTLISGNGEPVPLDFTGPYLRLGVKLVARGID